MHDEENPEPTVYDIVDPSKTICANFSQGNSRRFRQNAGKQCVTMSDCNNTKSNDKYLWFLFMAGIHHC